MALVLPVIVVLTLIVVQVGLVARDNLLVHHAAREGARRAAVEPTEAAARGGALAGSPALDPDRLSIDLDGGRLTGDRITVMVRYRAGRIVPLVGATEVELSARVTMRVE